MTVDKSNSLIKIADIFSSDWTVYHQGLSRLRAFNSVDNIRNWVITSPGPFCKKVSASGIELKMVNMNHESVNPLKDYRAIRSLRDVLSEELPDIVHTHNSKGGAIGRIAAKRSKVPFVVHQVHGFYYKRFAGLKRSIYDYFERFLAGYCDLILLQNQEDLKSCIERGMNKKTMLLHIGNGINLSEFPQSSSKRDSPKTSGQIRLVYIGRMDRNKNHQMLFDALSSLKGTVDYSLDLIGDGPLLGYNTDYVNSIGISDRVKFHGWVDKKEIPAFLSKAHVNILTSMQEGMPRAAMEAASMGVPTVGTNVVGTRDVVSEGKTGFLVPLGDYDGLASQIAVLYNDVDLWERTSKSCYEYASSNFDETIIIKRLVKIYRSIKNGTINELVSKSDCGINWDSISLDDIEISDDRKENCQRKRF
ncbi:hypothetical protein PHOSAC3_120087 [Mesotoga infera]|nr:hypothetical protein PHOSAC3_120087 [Mesotoga infera]